MQKTDPSTVDFAATDLSKTMGGPTGSSHVGAIGVSAKHAGQSAEEERGGTRRNAR